MTNFIYLTRSAENITGTSGTDVVYQFQTGFGYEFLNLGASDNDTISLLDGNDDVAISPGNDVLDGGDGRDSFRVNSFNDFVDGTDNEEDTVYRTVVPRDLVVNLAKGSYSAKWVDDRGSGPVIASWGGTITSFEDIQGTPGDDSFTGSIRGQFSVFRDDWVESYRPHAGNDFIDGNGGFDYVFYGDSAGAFLIGSSASDQPISVDMRTGTIRDPWGDTDTVVDIDMIIATFYDDFMGGGAGADIFYGGSGDDQLFGRGGKDELRGEFGDDTILGGGADDLLYGHAGEDVLSGDSANDRMVGGDGGDTDDGAHERDKLDFSNDGGTFGVNVLLKSGAIRDTYQNEETATGIENVTGTDLRDIINGNAQANVIIGGRERDTLGGLGGDDTIRGGAGRDNIGGGSGDDDLAGGNDKDTIFGGAGRDKIRGGAQDDILFGEEGADDIAGGEGDDQIRDDKMEVTLRDVTDVLWDTFADDFAQLPDDMVEGANLLEGNKGNDILLGRGYLKGGDGQDTLSGLGYLQGGAGADTITEVQESGVVGQAIIEGGKGADVITGGVVSYAYVQRGVNANLRIDTVDAGPGDRDTLRDIDSLVLTGFDDKLLIRGDKGGTFFTRGGDDTIIATDQVSGKFVYFLTGGGDDTIFVSGSSRLLDIQAGDGNDVIETEMTGQLNIRAGDGNDTITLRGTGEESFISERTVFGEAGKDTFEIKGAGRVDVDGGRQKDKFVVTKTNEAVGLFGGGSKDTFILKGTGLDVTIWDYNPLVEKLDLRGALDPQITSFEAFIDTGRNVGNDVTVFDLKGGGELGLFNLDVDTLQSDMILI